MTRQGWAERKVARVTDQLEDDLGPLSVAPIDAVTLLLAEHNRAVRVVKREIEVVKNDQRTYRSEEKCLILGPLWTVLKELQRGRE